MSSERQVTKFGSAPDRLRGLFVLGALLAVVVSLGVVGCRQAQSPDVLATVNGKSILEADVDRAYKQSLSDTAEQPAKEVAATRRLDVLHQMIVDEIMQQRAAKLNLVATDEEVDAKITDFKAPYTQEEFDRKLKERNQTLEDLRRDIRRQLTRNKLVNKEIESKINITDAQISGYFAAHKSEFNQIEPQYHLARIVVTNQPAQQVTNLQNNKATNDAEAKKKIQSLRNRLDAGEEFASVAARFSEDPGSSSNGGDVGFIYESSLKTDQDVFNILGQLKAGQYTEILPLTRMEGSTRKTMGYQIFQLIEKRPAGQREFNDPNVQQSIRQLLRNNQAQLLESAYNEVLYNEAKIHNYLAEKILRDGA